MPRYLGQRVPQIAAGAELADDMIIDVRELFEFNSGHAPNAKHIPLADLEQHRFSLPMNRRLVAMSRTGERGAEATIQLRDMGFQAVNFEGGLEAWAASGFPVVTDDGPAPG